MTLSDDQVDQPITLELELLELAADLGFHETGVLVKPRESITLKMPEDNSFQIIGEYQNLARSLTPGELDQPGSNVVMAVNIAAVAVMLRSGRNDDAREELHTLVMAADNLQESVLADYQMDLLNDIR